MRLPSVQLLVVASPWASLVSFTAPSTPPPPATKSTITPAAPLPCRSATLTTGAATPVATVPVCGSSDCLTSRVGAPGSAVALKNTGEPVKPPTDAVAVWVPAPVPSVRTAVETPAASVVSNAGVIDPPPDATAQLTGTPATGAPSAFLTTTAYGVAARTASMVSVCPLPACNAIVLAGDTNPSALNVTAGRPVAVAPSVFKPNRGPSVHVEALAIPAVSVVTVDG